MLHLVLLTAVPCSDIEIARINRTGAAKEAEQTWSKSYLASPEKTQLQVTHVKKHASSYDNKLRWRFGQ